MPTSTGKPVIYYIRHGQTDWNAQRRFQGQREVEMNETGVEQATGNGGRLARLITDPEAFDFVASPLGRARETMEIIRREMGLEPGQYRIDDRLIEASYGDLEGRSAHEVKRDFPDLWEWRKTDRWNFCPPNGESLVMVRERIAPVFDEIKRDTIIVAHGAIGRAVRQYLLDISEHDAAWFEFPQDRIFRFEDGRETLV